MTYPKRGGPRERIKNCGCFLEKHRELKALMIEANANYRSLFEDDDKICLIIRDVNRKLEEIDPSSYGDFSISYHPSAIDTASIFREKEDEVLIKKIKDKGYNDIDIAITSIVGSQNNLLTIAKLLYVMRIGDKGDCELECNYRILK